MFEKAWAKLHGSYEATASGQTGDTLNYLTGGLVSHVEIVDDKENGTDDEWETLLLLAGRSSGTADAGQEKAFLSCGANPIVL